MLRMPRVLILFAHPAIHKSRVNRQMARAVRELEGVTFHDLYEAYPDFSIDVAREQELLAKHDVIVFQHPLYWYSAPAIVKEWFDLVLEYGYAYGPGGNALQGKAWIHAMTAGGAESAYGPEGYNRFTLEELTRPFSQTAYLCQCSFLSPFVVHGTLQLDPRTEIVEVAGEYRRLIEALRDTARPFTELTGWKTINPHVAEILEGRPQ